MDRSRKLDTIADNLDEMSVTLEEIKEDVKTTEAVDPGKIDKIQEEMERATEMIEECTDPAHPEK
jgi:hypothetical protein